MYQKAIPIVRDLNKDGREDMALIYKNKKPLILYIQTERGYIPYVIDSRRQRHNPYISRLLKNLEER